MSGNKHAEHKHVWAQTYLGTNVSGHKRVWVQYLPGHKSVWAQTCLDTNMSGRKRVWAQMCLGPKHVWGQEFMSWNKRVLAQTYAGSHVVIVVWAQSCMGRNVVEPYIGNTALKSQCKV